MSFDGWKLVSGQEAKDKATSLGVAGGLAHNNFAAAFAQPDNDSLSGWVTFVGSIQCNACGQTFAFKHEYGIGMPDFGCNPNCSCGNQFEVRFESGKDFGSSSGVWMVAYPAVVAAQGAGAPVSLVIQSIST